MREGFAARRARVVRARYRLPSAALLKLPEHLSGPSEKELQQRAQALTQKLAEFAVTGQVTQINPSPELPPMLKSAFAMAVSSPRMRPHDTREGRAPA